MHRIIFHAGFMNILSLDSPCTDSTTNLPGLICNGMGQRGKKKEKKNVNTACSMNSFHERLKDIYTRTGIARFEMIFSTIDKHEMGDFCVDSRRIGGKINVCLTIRRIRI